MIELSSLASQDLVREQIRAELKKAGIAIVKPENNQTDYPRGTRGCWIFTRTEKSWHAIAVPNQGIPRTLATIYISVSGRKLTERSVKTRETLDIVKQTIDAFEIRSIEMLKYFADLLNDPKCRPHSRTIKFVIDK